MADIELKPCPFCGSKDIELRAGVVFNGAAHCKNCSADVVFDAVRMIAEGDYDWKTAVTNGWNNRAEDVVPKSEVDKAKREVVQRYMLKADGSLEMIPTVESVTAEFKCLVLNYIRDKDLLLVVFKNALEYAEAELKKKYIGE